MKDVLCMDGSSTLSGVKPVEDLSVIQRKRGKMIKTKIKYALSDIALEPADVSPIDSRSECNPMGEDDMLPLITAPMFSVVDDKNIQMFVDNGIYGIYPRGTANPKPLKHAFLAMSLDTFIKTYIEESLPAPEMKKVLIDMANGHMWKLHEAVRLAKNKHSDLIVMVGNVANPETFLRLCDVGADSIRTGIGGSPSCLTSANSSVHYPMASLIEECFEARDKGKYSTFLIADGGFKNFDDIIKALGLGADYVMCGSIFNKALESAGATYVKGHEVPRPNSKDVYSRTHQVDQYDENIRNAFKNGMGLVKEYYGMSTKRAQKEMGHENLKTSEGILKFHEVEYTLDQWVENFKHYLRTAMSYTGKRSLSRFIGRVDFNLISPQAFTAFYK